jgi:hypothetical protein
MFFQLNEDELLLLEKLKLELLNHEKKLNLFELKKLQKLQLLELKCSKRILMNEGHEKMFDY